MFWEIEREIFVSSFCTNIRNDRTGYHCEDDLVNYEVLEKLKYFTHKVFQDSPWHAVNALEDTVLWKHQDRLPNLYGSTPIESTMIEKPEHKDPSLFKKLLNIIDEKSLKLD